jgi:protein-disulfide isomerase
MKVIPRAVLTLLVSGTVLAIEPAAPIPISTNPADSPVRTRSGKVAVSTDADLPPALGPRDAKVVVVVFSDFQCPVCRRSADATDQIAEEFPGEVRVEFWQHPLPMHANAENAAVASLAAQRQGKFWEFHDEVFRNQSDLDLAGLTHSAEAIGLDLPRFQRDYAAPELRERARSEAAAANRFEARSTPAFLVNGKLKVGWGSWGGFRADVERELNEARNLEAQGTPGDQVAERRAEAQLTDAALFEAYRQQVLRIAPPPAAPDPPPQPEKKKHKHKKS